MNSSRGGRTVASVMEEIHPHVEPKLAKAFTAVGATFPPKDLFLLAFKDERRLEVWTWVQAGKDRKPVQVLTYKILAASGEAGPKLQQGDYQVPEGLYAIHALNPNSAFHLSLRVNYPNAFDYAQAKDEGRQNLGGDIFVHGNSVSAGCLAMGDSAIEELFTLAALVRPLHIPILISPYDFRTRSPASPKSKWLKRRYSVIEQKLNEFLP